MDPPYGAPAEGSATVPVPARFRDTPGAIGARPWPWPVRRRGTSAALPHGNGVVEERPELLSELPRRERLLEECRSGTEDAVAGDRVLRVPGREQHPHSGPRADELLGELLTAHPRHDHVGHEHVD